MIERAIDGNVYSFKISYDPTAGCFSPRDWSNLGHFYTWEQRHISPDKNPYYDYQDLIDDLGYDPVRSKTSKGVGIFVERYEHGDSIYSLYTGGPLTDKWDACVCGVIFATHKEIEEWFGIKRITKKVLEKVVRDFELQLDTYTQWANGYVYMVTCYDSNGDVVDTVGDIYGDEEDIEERILNGEFDP